MIGIPGGLAMAVQPATVYQITGIVISSVDEAPVAHAHLSATLATRGRPVFGQRSSENTVDADDHGRFVLTLPSSGAWHLTASATGFVTRAYDEHDGYSSAVVLSAAAPTIDLRFLLPPEATISGTVLDEAGEAVRDARVMLQHRTSDSLNLQESLFQNRMTVQTDDRGVYQCSDLAAGDYRILVDAKPWYSLASQPGRVASTNGPPPDPSLDVTYQLTWYPGVNDPEEAEILALHAAEDSRADFHLIPIPAVHLQFAAPAQPGPGGRPIPVFPILERIDTGGGGSGIGQVVTSATGSQGQVDIGGLAPGLYRVRTQSRNGPSETSVIQIGSGVTGVVDASTASAAMANIILDIDNNSDEEQRAFGVELRNTETGVRFTSFDRNVFMSARRSADRKPQSTSLQVPPGRYEILLMTRGEGGAYLVGATAKGAEVKGRFLTVRAGTANLTLHTSRGFASMSGIVASGGKPVIGAIVLLVPASLGDPGSFATLVKDQSNTDGSFDLNNIVPGPYILIAVDHGWGINWNDPSTLQRYLTQGVPLELRSNANIKQNIEASTP
jgi:hypothetical protein